MTSVSYVFHSMKKAGYTFQVVRDGFRDKEEVFARLLLNSAYLCFILWIYGVA